MPSTATSPALRRFSVHPRSLDRHHARIVEEASFEAAAVAFVELVHPAVEDDGAINLIVRDLDEGGEHCFCLDLDTGETQPCEAPNQ